VSRRIEKMFVDYGKQIFTKETVEKVKANVHLNPGPSLIAMGLFAVAEQIGRLANAYIRRGDVRGVDEMDIY
jgi:hypothetical protein